MRRREFITLLGGAAVAWPLAARAQENKRPRRVGVLTTLAESDPEDQLVLGTFRSRLAELGWIEGQTVEFIYRRTMGIPERAQVFASELAGLNPDVILSVGGTATSALVRASITVPAVFVSDTDPVAAGFVASMAHPGGNITGFSSFERTLGTKWLQILKTIAPDITRVVIVRSDNPYAKVTLPTILAALPSFHLQATDAIIRDAVSVEQAIDTAAKMSGVGLIVLASTIGLVNRDAIIAGAATHRLPAVYTNSTFARSGGLVSYGIDRVHQFQEAGGYIDRILHGEKPADLPVQTPSKFELVINMKTARLLGLDVDPTLLALADEVIE